MPLLPLPQSWSFRSARPGSGPGLDPVELGRGVPLIACLVSVVQVAQVDRRLEANTGQSETDRDVVRVSQFDGVELCSLSYPRQCPCHNGTASGTSFPPTMRGRGRELDPHDEAGAREGASLRY
ncbi:hypothetical protein FPOA_09646 [Fusarium poae]|uniref:Uncharacterized protein n=1 Tax=Fusarium poae TaxID=36050 RepID=A0A1B8ABR6_FUSPO|nr:hypothetical protein FPOA_09646 [Fusarium poae]